MTDIELKPCPFCGGKVKIINIVQHYMVYCRECTSVVGMFDNQNTAVKAWNRRVDNFWVSLQGKNNTYKENEF